MKNKFVKVLAAVTVSSVLSTNIAYAAEPIARKSETIYVTKEADQVKDQTVSIWINGDKELKLKDKSDLKEIRNLETDEEITTKDGYINWNSDQKDIYYQGKTDKDLPVDVNVRYILDGKEVSYDELNGATGHVKIVVDAKNKMLTKANIDGSDRDIYSPYLVVAEMTFDSASVTNIKAPNAKIVKDGKNEIVTGIITPGLKSNFEGILDNDILDKFKDEMEIEIDVTNYKPTETYIVITNEVFQDEKNLSSIDDLANGVDELTTNADKLLDASSKLADGSKKLNDGIGEISNGADKLAEGSTKLNNSFGEFQQAFATVPEKIKPIGAAVSQLNDGGSRLNTGLNQYTSGVSQINANIDKLSAGSSSLKNGAIELDSGIRELKKGTTALREKTAALDSSKMGEFITGLSKLKTGLDEFSKNISPMVDAVDDLNVGLNNLNEGSNKLSAGLDQLNTAAQNAPSMEGSITDIANRANSIENVISNLESANVDGSLDAEIANLRAIKEGLYVDANSLKVNAGTNAAIKEGLGELSTASKELSSGLSRASVGIKELATSLDQSQEQISKASKSLAGGIGQFEDGFDDSDITKLTEAIVMLDEGVGKIQAGSEKLVAGTSQNEEAISKLSAAINQLDSKSADLNSGSEKLSAGLAEFEKRSQALQKLTDINDTAINPMAEGINELNNGILELRNGATKLKEGSDTYVSSYEEFDSGLRKYKDEGIDKLTDKAGDLAEVKDILDEMKKLAKENNSISGSTDDFETRSRIIEKIK